LRSMWKTYYVKTKAVIMVIDSTDKHRLHISRNELHTMLEDEVRLCEILFLDEDRVYCSTFSCARRECVISFGESY
jgi:hypothetical protein